MATKQVTTLRMEKKFKKTPSGGLQGYAEFLNSLKTRIREAQVKASLSVNRELILLYWDIGSRLHAEQKRRGWGTAVIPLLAKDLRNEMPEVKGFSERNIGYMLAFTREYGLPPVLQQPVAKLPDSDFHLSCGRRSIRLRKYDYSQAGAYFVTVCAQERACLFGRVVDGEMRLNDAGEMIQRIWNELPGRYAGISLDAFVIMPNHIHGIIVIVGASLVGAQNNPANINRATTRVAPTLGGVVGGFKSLTTNEYIRGVKQCGWQPFRGRLWQRNFYEHVIRSEDDMNGICQYIVFNPAQWHDDEYHPLAATANLATVNRATTRVAPTVGAQNNPEGRQR